ncbi:hypothetical protein GOODEAATRI_011677, partial [Goodea atripinnis]
LGLERYHGVGILGFNSAEWFIADIGAILAGYAFSTRTEAVCSGFAVGIYTTNSSEACHYVAENSKANIIVVENHKQLQKILQITWTALSTGKHVHLKDATQSQEVVVSYLPLSHIAAQMVDIWVTMRVGGATYFAQPDALKEKMKSVGAKSSAVRRKVAAWAKDVGLQTNLTKMNQNAEAGRAPFSYQVAKKLVFKKVRKALGLDRCNKCYTGAAPITKDTLEFFLSLDIPLYELYGMSETTGPHTISTPEAFKLTSCGKEIPGCKTKLHSPDEEGNGEICFWGRHIFMGYLNMLDKTEEAIDKDGWLHSGDLGKHDESGFLFITGRIKELIITAGGENVPPIPIEDAVKEAVPLISNAMLIGDKRKFLTMLLTIKVRT